MRGWNGWLGALGLAILLGSGCSAPPATPSITAFPPPQSQRPQPATVTAGPAAISAATASPTPRPSPVRLAARPTGTAIPAPAAAAESATPTSTPIPEPMPDQQVFTGMGDSLTRIIEVQKGIIVLEAVHRGSRNFIVKVVPEGGGREETSISAVGDYRGTRAHHVADGDANKLGPGPYRVEVHADGEWEIEVAQPLWNDAPPPPIVVRPGRGDAVIGPVRLDSGEYSVKLGYTGSKNFTAELISADGESFEHIASAVGAYQVSHAVRIQRNAQDGLRPGVYVLVIHADGEWNAEIGN